MKQNNQPTKKIPNHQEAVEVLIQWFKERGIEWLDFEDIVGDKKIERPDLLLPKLKTLVEVKTLQPQKEEQKEAGKLSNKLKQGNTATYWRKHFFGRFGEDLRSANQKFRNFPDYTSLVVIFDFHSRFHRQEPQILLTGVETLIIAVPKDPKVSPRLKDQIFQKRSIRFDKNNEIGAVAFVTGRNTFQVYHNTFAKTERRVKPKIFDLPTDNHFKISGDSRNPTIS